MHTTHKRRADDVFTNLKSLTVATPKRQRVTDVPDCDFEGCPRECNVFLEVQCDSGHVVCADCLQDAFEANAKLIPLENGPMLTSVVVCPGCDAADQLSQTDKPCHILSNFENVRTLNPKWVRAFDDSRRYECPCCPLEGSLVEISRHIVKCNRWEICCPECRTKVPLSGLSAHKCPLPACKAAVTRLPTVIDLSAFDGLPYAAAHFVQTLTLSMQNIASIFESKDPARLTELVRDLQAAGEKKLSSKQLADNVAKSGTLSEQVMRIRMAYMKPVLHIAGVGKERAAAVHPGPPY